VLKLADEVGEKKSATDSAEADERAQRIEKLYNTAAGLDKFSTAIPLLIERLTALKAIHEKGADFAKTVAHLDATQKQLEAMFANDKKMLEKVICSPLLHATPLLTTLCTCARTRTQAHTHTHARTHTRTHTHTVTLSPQRPRTPHPTPPCSCQTAVIDICGKRSQDRGQF
jgi:hypothetical protein